MSDDKVEICCDILKETDEAFLVRQGDLEVWVPKSQFVENPDEYMEGDENVSFSIPIWLAEKKGLV